MLDSILGQALLDLTSTLEDPISSYCKVCNVLYEVLHPLNKSYSGTIQLQQYLTQSYTQFMHLYDDETTS